MVSSSGTILVVDSDAAQIAVITGVLQAEFDIVAARSVAEALAVLHTTTPDAVLLDVALSDGDGFQICTRIRQDHRLADIPVVFLTARDDRESEARGLELGAMDYIVRPVSPAVLRLRVRHQVELKNAREELRRLVATDALTGLPNRRRFDEVLEREWRRLGRSGGILSLVLLDIDHFKRFNDFYGHLAGDSCLRRVAHCVSRLINRAADLPARYGGEEFVCILPETDPAGATVIAERLRASIAALAIPHERSPTAPCVTVSLGVATGACRIGQSPLQLLGLADEQLYAAKDAGRNRVMGATLG